MNTTTTIPAWVDQIQAAITNTEWEWRQLDEQEWRSRQGDGQVQTALAKQAKQAEASRLRAELAVASFLDAFHMAVRAAREIEQRLLQEPRASERALFDQYLRTANRTNRPAVALSASTMITNAAAARLLQPSDHAVLWEVASRALATQRLVTPEVTLATGASVAARCDPVYDGGDLIGIAVRLYPAREQAESSARVAARTPELPGLVGRSELWRMVCVRAWQAARSTGVVQLVGR